MAEPSRLDTLRRRVQADPASIAFAALAEEYRRAGRFTDAIDTARAGLAHHPSYASARVTLGRALFEAGEREPARVELEQALASAPENLAAIRALAELYREAGEVTRARDLAKRGSALAPQDREFRHLLDALETQVRRSGLSVIPFEFAPRHPARPAAAPNVPEPPPPTAALPTPVELPSMASPAAPPSLAAPIVAPLVAEPVEPPSMAAPVAAPLVAEPVEPPSMAAPAEPPSLAAPIVAPLVAEPVEPPSMAAPAAPPSLAAPIVAPSVAAPVEAPSMASPAEPPSMAAPAEPPSVVASVEPGRTAPRVEQEWVTAPVEPEWAAVPGGPDWVAAPVVEPVEASIEAPVDAWLPPVAPFPPPPASDTTALSGESWPDASLAPPASFPDPEAVTWSAGRESADVQEDPLSVPATAKELVTDGAGPNLAVVSSTTVALVEAFGWPPVGEPGLSLVTLEESDAGPVAAVLDEGTALHVPVATALVDQKEGDVPRLLAAPSASPSVPAPPVAPTPDDQGLDLGLPMEAKASDEEVAVLERWLDAIVAERQRRLQAAAASPARPDEPS